MIRSDTIAAGILREAVAQDFGGYDPFDGLNSRLFEWFPVLKDSMLGLAWIQLFKRSPLNLRPLSGVPKGRNPKGVALFILGLLNDYQRTGQAHYLETALPLADWLLEQRCDRDIWQSSCWGYHFDWKARAFFVPKGKPNIITTIYVARALLALASQVDSCDAKQACRYRIAACEAADFIVNSLSHEHGGKPFFAYIPGEKAFVHNASLWGAAWVAKIGALTDNQDYKTLAIRVAEHSVSCQGCDGSWVYGSRHHHQFIDGFHTGYNLEALHIIRTELGTSQFDQAIDTGLTYYREKLFETDGTARYYHNNRYPLDMHSVAQAVITLQKVGGTHSDRLMAENVIRRSIHSLYHPRRGKFVYQKNRLYTNPINYMRWTQAWIYYSFTFFHLHTQQS